MWLLRYRFLPLSQSSVEQQLQLFSPLYPAGQREEKSAFNASVFTCAG